MVSYSSMTLRQAADEVLVRVGQARTATNLDYDTVVMLINRSRREVMSRTRPFKDWAYIKNIQVVDGTELPQEFVSPVRVLLKSASMNANEYVEARQVDVREWWSLTNTSRPHSWNGASDLAPVYMLWGSSDSSDATWAGKGLHFYCAPSSHTGFMEYYAEYSDATSDSTALNVPYEAENLVILGALSRVYMKVGELQKAQSTYRQVQQNMASMRKRIAASKQTEAINTEALASSEPTQVQTTLAG